MEDLPAFLAKTVLFSVLPPATLPAIARAATCVTLAKGEVLFEAGTAGDAVFFVRSGLLQIVSASALDGQPLGEAARSLPLIDVLIRPDLDGFSSADLDGAAEMCERGERAAEEAMSVIRDAQPSGTPL